MDAPQHTEQTTHDTPATTAPRRTNRRRFAAFGIFAALMAVVVFVTTPVFAQTPTQAPPPRPTLPAQATQAAGQPGGVAPMGPMGRMGQMGQMGDKGFGFGRGFQAVVTNVNAGANTITLAGVPQQIATVQVNSGVTLQVLNPDGTTRAAAIGDFRTGSLVRIGFGRAQAAAGAATNTPAAGVGNRIAANFAVNQLTLVPDNLASVSGLVLANANGVITVATEGGLRVTVRTAGNTTYTKNNNQAATAADVTVGTRISATGTQGNDGITAATVRVFDLSMLPQGNGQGGQGGPGGPGGRGGFRGPMGQPGQPGQQPAAPAAPAVPTATRTA